MENVGICPDAGQPFFNAETGPIPGYVVGECGHRVAQSEWDAGFRTCERCPSTPAGLDAQPDADPHACPHCGGLDGTHTIRGCDGAKPRR